MKVVSVNVGMPREIIYRDEPVMTGIYKDPVEGRIQMEGHNFIGDAQADLIAHGGEFKAVYGYPIEHYPLWQAELGRQDLTYGQFGENLTTEGLLEQTMFVGSVYRVGNAVLQITQPRMPCYKLEHKMGIRGFIKTFQQSGRSGFYFRIVEAGDVGAGDLFELLHADQQVSVWDFNHWYTHREAFRATAEKILRIESVPPDWKEYIEKVLAG